MEAALPGRPRASSAEPASACRGPRVELCGGMTYAGGLRQRRRVADCGSGRVGGRKHRAQFSN